MKALRLWLLGALAAFCDGLVDGIPVGVPAGGGIAAADGAVHATLTAGNLWSMAAHILAIPVLSGLADLRAYQKAHPLTALLPPTANQ